MNKENILNLIKITEEELVEQTSNYNLNAKELEVINKGKELFEEIKNLDDNSKRKILFSLILYAVSNENSSK